MMELILDYSYIIKIVVRICFLDNYKKIIDEYKYLSER